MPTWLSRFLTESGDALALLDAAGAVTAHSAGWRALVGGQAAAALQALGRATPGVDGQAEVRLGGLRLRSFAAPDGGRLVHALGAPVGPGRFFSLIDAFPFAIGVHRDLRFLYVNRAAVRYLGYDTVEELIGKPITTIVDRSDLEVVGARVGHMMRTGQALPERETRLVRKDGGLLVADLSAFRIVDEDGLPSFVVIARDISERKAFEERLRHGQRMEAVGRLAGGIAHDFNNLLAVIQSYAELMLHELPEGSAHAEHAAEIHRGAERAAVLTQQLLTFSRGQVSEPEILRPNEIIYGLLGLLRRSLGADVTLTTALQANLPPVRASALQLEQILVNLAINAGEAMPRGGALTIRSFLRQVPAPEALPGDGPRSAHGGPAPGSYVGIEVVDDGVGMTPEVSSRAFDPFFTTKPPGRGTGLGLSTVYGIVSQAGGSCEIASQPGAGTTVRILWPAALDAVAAPVASSAPRPTAGAAKGGRVLVVEDDEAVRMLVARLLRGKGFEILEACDPETALELVERLVAEGAPPPDLVLSDVVMPRMDGPELVRALQRRVPGLPAVFMSGFADEVIERDELAEQGFGFIAKPFATAELVAKVQEGIAAGRAARGGAGE